MTFKQIAEEAYQEYLDIKPLPLEPMSENDLKWHIRFIGLAHHISSFSKDPSTQVGAVIVRPNRTISSMGYNGFPRGCDDNPKLYANREEKYKRILHAEINAILSCSDRPEGHTLYVWPPGFGPTCERCATAVIQSGIKRVIYLHKQVLGEADYASRWYEECKLGLKLYGQAGVETIGIPTFHYTVYADRLFDYLGSSSKG